MAETPNTLLAGRLLARNTIWNLIGIGAPLVVAFVAVPLLIDDLGTERFGLLTLIWVGVGYFSLFDAGLGRALTKLIAERLGQEDSEELRDLIWSGILTIAALGLVAAGLVVVAARPVVEQVLTVSAGLQAEAILAFRVLGASLPLVIVNAALIGILEAHQRFPTIVALRIPLGVITYAGPLAVAQLTPDLGWVTAALIASRLAAFLGYLVATSRVRPEVLRPRLPSRRHLKELLGFGGWITVTNIVGPLMVYFDRFLIGAVLTMTAVAFYTTPYEVLSRAQLMPNALMAVLFPAFSTAFAVDQDRLASLYRNTIRAVALVMIPLLAIAFLFAPEGLMLWLGPEFAQKSAPVARWLAAGWMLNVLARPPFTVLQGVGRPDLTAKTHLAELIPYFALIWFLTQRFGIVGAAVAWAIRVAVDSVILNELARRIVPSLSASVRTTYVIGGVLLGGIGLGLAVSSALGRGALSVATVIVALMVFGRPLRSSLRNRTAVSDAGVGSNPFLRSKR